MRDSDIEVEETTYGVLIRDINTLEGVAVEKKNIKKLIQDLQEHLEWDLNETAIYPEGLGGIVVDGLHVPEFALYGIRNFGEKMWGQRGNNNEKPEKPEGDDPRAGKEIPPLM